MVPAQHPADEMAPHPPASGPVSAPASTARVRARVDTGSTQAVADNNEATISGNSEALFISRQLSGRASNRSNERWARVISNER